MTLATKTTDTSAPNADVIDQLAGSTPESVVATLRAQRPDITRYAQSSYEALFAPEDLGGVSAAERALLALRVAALTRTPALAEWHRAHLQQFGASAATIAAIEDLSTAPDAVVLSPREVALLQHTDRVARQPAASTKADLAALTAVGLSPRDIVTISQVIAFLSFQVRTLHGLRALAEDV